MKPQSCLTRATECGLHTEWLSRAPSLNSSLPSLPRTFTHPMIATAGASTALRRVIALVFVQFVFTLADTTLHAQQSPGQGWPPYSQGAGYVGQYPQDQQSGYPQRSYPQPSYPAPNQAIPNPIYAQADPMPDYGQQAQLGFQPLTANKLEQLLAPIALYPDTLVAQVLAAATYPAQVVCADHWLQGQSYAAADQIAAGADAQAWDPSVKALTAFPQVLAQMDRNLQWTTDLGNAYYNQPQDVLQTIQVLRQRAETAGTLQNTPQEAVSYNQGYIQLAPVNPQVVYVPAYNPWSVYGEPVAPYRGFSLFGSLASLAGSSPLQYGLGIAMSAFSHTPFGWAGWALNWLTQSILFHQSNYQSNSTTVAHLGYQPNGGLRRGEASRTAASYGQPATEYSRQVFAHQSGRNPEYSAENRPDATSRPIERFNHDYPAQPRNYGRPGFQAYDQLRPSTAITARQQAEGRSGYGSSFYGNSPQTYSHPYASTQQPWRSSAPTPQRNDSAQRSYLGERSYSGYDGSPYNNHAFGESSARSSHSGGFHLFGHNSEKSYSYGGGHAPKGYSGGKGFGKGRSGGSGRSSGHHSGGHHH